MAHRTTHPRFRDPYADRSIAEELKHLWVVTAISNPARYRTRYNLYLKFRDHVLNDLGGNLLTVECALGDRDFCILQDADDDERVIDVGVRGSSWVWLKENLMNIGVSRLPPAAKYILFCDADITFCNSGVLGEIVHALQTYRVVQPFETCADLGPHGDIFQVHRSFADCVARGWDFRPRPCTRKNSVYGYVSRPPDPGASGSPWHPGFCVAMRRSTFDALGGLYDLGILGAGDHHFMCALIDKVELSMPGGVSDAYKKSLEDYRARVRRAVNGLFGRVRGTILHGYHGSKESRGYVSRWAILVKHAYCPYTDVLRNSYGVLELTGDKPGLRDDIIRYFRSRNEDVL